MNVFGTKLRLFWERITFSKITTFYFLFSIAHCFVQVVLQIQAFSINQQAASFLYSVLKQGNATDPNGFTVLGQQDLRMCDNVPSSFSTASCRVLWNGTALNDNVISSTSSAISPTLQTVVNAATDPASAVSATSVTSAVSTSTSAAVSQSSTSSTAKSLATSSKPDIDNAAALPTGIRTLTVFAPAPTSVADDTKHVEVTDKGDNDDDKEDDGHHDDKNDGKKNSKRDHSALGKIAATVIDGQIQVQVTGLGYNDDTVMLDRSCLWALNYPVGILLNTKREDITFIAFQFWVLGMSIVAILNESIPHSVATLLTHVLATAWAGFQIKHTSDFRQNFSRVATNGACKPINLLPRYWKDRGNAEIPLLALNVVALLVSTFLTWRLIKLFGWQTFKRVGASVTINRVYKLVLTLSITIQLALFFMVASLGLWIDQLWNGQIARLARLADVYRPVFVIVLILLVPWLGMGWFAVRRELRIPMLIFLVLSFGYLAGSGAMFASTTFRWTFVQWRFFSLIASASMLLTLMAFGLGLLCRLNFGKGLSRYLNAQEPIPDERIPEPFVPEKANGDLEKVDFPSHTEPIPTFSVAFGHPDEVPPPSQMFVGRQRGPRFYSESAEPFETHTHSMVSSLERTPSSGSLSPEHDLYHHTRQDSKSSQRSGHSAVSSQNPLTRSDSQSSQRSDGSAKRWVIE